MTRLAALLAVAVSVLAVPLYSDRDAVMAFGLGAITLAILDRRQR